LCAAQPEYLPIELDETGYRDGQSYRYASINSIRRSTLAAHSKHGLLVNHVYADNDKGEYVTTVVRHVSGEYFASTSPIPVIADVQERKANKTLLCRTHIEGLLGIITERDDDGASVNGARDADRKAEWEANLRMCKASIQSATTNNKVAHYETLAKQRIAEGRMAPDSELLITKWCKDRLVEISKEDTNARAEGDGRDQGTDATGSGSRASSGGVKRGAAVST
jgi:hypothetical protein